MAAVGDILSGFLIFGKENFTSFLNLIFLDNSKKYIT